MTRIRPGDATDLDAIVEVFWACWTRSYRRFATEASLAVLDREAADQLWRDAMRAPGQCLVADDGSGRVFGVVRFQIADGEVQVHSLYVHPDAQGLGLGARLLRAATDQGVAAGALGAALWVFAENAASLAFYRSQGWWADGGRRVQEAFGIPELRMRRTLDPALASVARTLIDPAVVCEADGEHAPSGVVIGTGDRIAAAGARNRAGDPMLPSTTHDLASITKLVTTTACMTLCSRGDLDLDRPLGDYVPGAGQATVRDALQHSAGFPSWYPLYVATDTAEQALASALELERGPVGQFRYSDLGFMVLGEVVSRITSKSLDEALSLLVLAPLGVDIAFAPGDELVAAGVASSALGDGIERAMVAAMGGQVTHDAAAFAGWRSGEIVSSPNDGNATHAFGGVSGHAGLFGSVPALLALGRALARADDRTDLWSPPVVDEFLSDGPHPGQALGFRSMVSGRRRLLFHPGFTGCVLGFERGADAVVLASNRLLGDGEPVPSMRLWAHLLRALEES